MPSIIEKISFNQSDIVAKIHDPCFSELRKIQARFSGLCELISNYVIFENLLDKGLRHPPLFFLSSIPGLMQLTLTPFLI